jgi:hypothetical protein
MAILTLMQPTVITAPVTGVVTVPIEVNEHEEAIFTAIFDYGSGGTNAKAWVQTSIDGGLTWFDVANFAFALADATRISEVNANVAAAANYTPTDATLADNTVKDGLLGSKYRVKYTTTGTYGGNTTLEIKMHTR